MDKSILNLTRGDLIDVIAPASRCPQEELQAGCEYLESLGFITRVPVELFGDHPYLANDDKKRFLQLKKALTAKDSKAIWCARGGYGVGRIMPDVVNMKRPSKPKALIGLSDITALHIWLNCEWKWPSWHAPILSRLGSKRASNAEREVLKNVLADGQRELEYGSLVGVNEIAKRMVQSKKAMTISAKSMVGGNLALVETSLATPWQIKTKNRILFLEDAGERGYKLDRMLNHLKQARIFENVAAVVLGDFTEGDEANGQNHVDRALNDFFSSLKSVPVFRGLQTGHGPVQMPVPFGVPVRIESGCVLKFKL